jgi:ABC-type nitrate/sulfonate/bicarbonate transport system substrate-binding protein
MKAKWILVLAIVYLLSLSITAIAQTITVKYGMIPSSLRSVSSLPLYVAQKRGFFDREGLNLNVIPIEGGTDKMVAAVDRGVVDITRTATPYLILASVKGSDAVAIAGEQGTPIYSLVVQPNIQSFKELKGKLIGLSLKVDTISISMRKLLARHGLHEADYQVRELVGTPVRLKCLDSGECAGVPLNQPEDFIAMKRGYRRLGMSIEAMPNFVFTVSAARRSWAKENKDSVVRYVRALASADRYMRAPANREDVVSIAVEKSGTTAEIAREVLSLYFEPERGVFPKQAELDLKGLQQVVQLMAESGELKTPLPKVEQFVDLQFLQAAGIR